MQPPILDDSMGDLDYPETAAVVDRQTLERLADLEKEIQVFRGLRHLWAQSVSRGGDDPGRDYLRRTADGQIWQIVYFALRLFDQAYPNATKTPHEKFAPAAFGDRLERIQEAEINLKDALTDDQAGLSEVVKAAQALLDALRPAIV